MQIGSRLRLITFTMMILGLIPQSGFAGLGDITEIRQRDNQLTLLIGKHQVLVRVCGDNILKVDYRPEGRCDADTPILSEPQWPAITPQITGDGNTMIIRTSQMIVKIQRTPCRIAIYDTQDRLLVKEQDGEGVFDDGLRLWHALGQDFYGIGGFSAFEDSTCAMLRNSGGPVHAGHQGDGGAPFVWSTSGYGILIDSDGGQFNLQQNDLTFTNCSKTNITYFIITGTPRDILSSLAMISGKPPMFPKWAMGFSNSEWKIDEKELTDIIANYRAKNIPIDTYILDFDWKAWGDDQYGEWRWNESKFPNGPSGRLKDTMAAQGIKLTGIMKPRIHVDTQQGRDATTQNFWVAGKAPYKDYFSLKMVNDVDFSSEACRQWFFAPIKQAFDTGIVGWWNDEADGFNNWEFMNMQRALYDGQRQYSPLRVWSINRNFYLGSQRYAYGMWSGDIQTGFDSMEHQRERMLSAINLGECKWGMDTGGFFDKPDSENYVRWLQFSALVPIFRVHGYEWQQRQPWIYGEQAEQRAREVIQLRYRLIPYIYAYERRAYENGIGLVTPLFWHYPQDPEVANRIDEWMFGDYLLAAPVVRQGQISKPIYLPAGIWIDYHKGQTYAGNQMINYPIDPNTWRDIPLFIKKGAIIPTQPAMNYVDEKPVTTITLSIFPDENAARFAYYDDDGQTYDYEKGIYYRQIISAQTTGEGVSVKMEAPEGSFNPPLKHYLCKVYGPQPARNVFHDGRELPICGSPQELENSSAEGWFSSNDHYGPVTCIKLRSGQAQDIRIESTAR